MKTQLETFGHQVSRSADPCAHAHFSVVNATLRSKRAGRTMGIVVAVVGVMVLSVFGVGCSNVSSTTQRAGEAALGAAAAGGLAYGITNRDPVKTGIATVVGGAITSIGMGEDPAVRQAGFDQGYLQGQSDAIKREYFLRKADEAKPAPEADQAGQSVYYVLPGPTTTWDGRKLEPHQVAVRVVE